MLRPALALLLCSQFLPALAHAFPEMVRAGYVNCSTCHHSATGGGLLTPYGRALSKEVLSHGSFFFEAKPAPDNSASVPDDAAPKEEDFLYGHAPLPKWAEAGGDLRFLQLYTNTQNAIDLRFITMQLDLEGRVQFKRLSLQASAGRQDAPPNSTTFTDSLISRHHWLSLELGPEGHEDRLQLRGGRFFPAYGLNLPEHNVVTRQALGFDQDQETYNVEAAWIDENINVFATAILGRPDAATLKRQRGASMQLWTPLGTTSKIGANALTQIAPGQGAAQRKNLVGLNGILGFSPHHYALLEIDGTHSVATRWGAAEYLKLGWEIDQGFHLFLDQEYAKTTYLDPKQIYESYGVGLQYFPRPHWELLGIFAKQRMFSLSADFSTAAWFMLHYYL